MCNQKCQKSVAIRRRQRVLYVQPDVLLWLNIKSVLYGNGVFWLMSMHTQSCLPNKLTRASRTVSTEIRGEPPVWWARWDTRGGIGVTINQAASRKLICDLCVARVVARILISSILYHQRNRRHHHQHTAGSSRSNSCSNSRHRPALENFLH